MTHASRVTTGEVFWNDSKHFWSQTTKNTSVEWFSDELTAESIAVNSSTYVRIAFERLSLIINKTFSSQATSASLSIQTR